jgi:predicted Zn-dependent peptidase
MRRLILIAFLSILTVAAPAPAQDHPSELPSPKPLRYEPPGVERVTLQNGIEVFLLEDHELPLFNATAYIRTGSVYDPPDKAGLAGLVGAVMRTGGTKTRTGDDLDEELEFLSASVETGISEESGTASLSVLAKDIDRGLAIFADVLMNPEFRQDKLDLAKAQTLDGIRRRYDNPGEIARWEFRKIVWGKESPWARRSTVESVSRITREDLVAFHQKYVHPNHVLLGVAGDFQKADLLPRLEKAFAAWRPVPVQLPEVQKTNPDFKPGVYLVRKELSQSTIRIGHVGIQRHSPDQYAVAVMNEIFGAGTFTSRLGTEVRSSQGLAYAVFGSILDGVNGGMFLTVCQTKAETTARAIALMKNIIAKMQTEPITDQEMQDAKNALINSFIFKYASPAQIVGQKVSLKYDGYPDDYLETYIERIQKVTKEDVLRVARQYIRPDGLAVFVLGKPEKFDRPMTDFGPVSPVSLPPLAAPDK